MNTISRTTGFLFFFFLIFTFLFFFAQKNSYAQMATSCWVTEFGNSPVNFPLPDGCGRRVQCDSGLAKHDCAYKNILDYTRICCRWTGVHKGVDLIADKETPQYALEDVRIVSRRFEGCIKPSAASGGPGSRKCTEADDRPNGQRWFHGRSTGWHIRAVSVRTGRCYYYFHMSRQSPRAENSIVRAGELIGYTGETGHSPGPPHLHLQVSPPLDENNPQRTTCRWLNPDTMLGNYPNI